MYLLRRAEYISQRKFQGFFPNCSTRHSKSHRQRSLRRAGSSFGKYSRLRPWLILVHKKMLLSSKFEHVLRPSGCTVNPPDLCSFVQQLGEIHARKNRRSFLHKKRTGRKSLGKKRPIVTNGIDIAVESVEIEQELCIRLVKKCVMFLVTLCEKQTPLELHRTDILDDVHLYRGNLPRGSGSQRSYQAR